MPTPTPETILLTGATGQVGMSLLPRLLAAPETRVIALVRAKDPAHLEKRRREMVEGLGVGAVGAVGARLLAMQGDVTREHLGLSVADRERAFGEVTSVLHSAASVRFDMPEDTAAKENMDSTANVLAFSRTLAQRGRLHRHDHISTAYVAGERLGRVYERECDEGQKFRNSYEWSKCQSEKKVRALQAEGFPAAIHRPSIVVGDSRTGETRAFNVMYWPLKLYARGLWGVFPGRADTLVDAVPVDWVASTIASLRLVPETLGRCFHVAAGDDAMTVEALAAHIAKLVGRRPLRFVDQGAYRKYIRPVLKPVLSLHPKGRAIMRGGNAYMPYFLGNPLFDTTELRGALGEGGRAPGILEYLSRVIAYAQDKDWGRKA